MTRTWIAGAVTASLLLSGCSGGSDKGSASTAAGSANSTARTSSGSAAAGNGTASAPSTAAAKLEPGQTGPATKELSAINGVLRQVSAADDKEHEAEASCARIFGTPGSISPIVGTAVTLSFSSGMTNPSRPPAEDTDHPDLQRWALSCMWVDSTTPDARVTRRLEIVKLTPDELAADVDDKAKQGWGVICLVSPTQWTAKPPNGNVFYRADMDAQWPDAWDKQESRNGVTIGCRANNMSAAQYGKTTKARASEIDARAVKLQKVGLDNLAK